MMYFFISIIKFALAIIKRPNKERTEEESKIL